MTKSGSAVKVLFVTTELAPFSKVGGLGDVAGSLPKALRQAGVDVRVVTPAWPGVLEKVAAQGVKTTTLKTKVYAAYDWRIHSATVIKATSFRLRIIPAASTPSSLTSGQLRRLRCSVCRHLS